MERLNQVTVKSREDVTSQLASLLCLVTPIFIQTYSYSEDSLNLNKCDKKLFFFCLHNFNHNPFLFSFLVLQFSVSRQISHVLKRKSIKFEAFTTFFCNNLICINKYYILQSEEIVFTTPKCQQYQLTMISLCLAIPDPIPEWALASSVLPVLLFMVLTMNCSRFSVLERRGEVTLKYGHIHNKYPS